MASKPVCISYKQGKNKELICIGFIVNDTFKYESYPVFQFIFVNYESDVIETCCRRYEQDNLVNPDYFYHIFFDIGKTGSIEVPDWIEKYFKVMEDLFHDVHKQMTKIPF